jgi:hypothetical protein
LTIPAHIVARLHILRTRAALPAWVLVALAFLGELSDVWDGASLLWRWAASVPLLAWLTSSTGLLLLAVLWVVWLLLRPISEADALRLDRVRSVLREAAVAIRQEADRVDAATDLRELSSRGYDYMLSIDLLDDACVATVKAAYDEFMRREERMHKAADVPFSHLRTTADYLERVAARLTIAEIDPGFRLPESFADWSKGHQPNIRPVRWTR